MKRILSILLVLGLTSLSLYAGGLDGLGTEVEQGKGVIFTLLKVFGFAIILWGVTDIMGETQGQEKGSQFIKAIIKIVVGGILIGAGKIADVLGVFA